MDNAMRAILEAAREYGFFEHRADVANYDWTLADFPAPLVWYNLNLTGIVPEHTKAVLYRGIIRSTVVDSTLQLRRNGYTNPRISSWINNPTANIYTRRDMVGGIGPDRIIQGQISHAGINAIFLVVKGWWW